MNNTDPIHDGLWVRGLIEHFIESPENTLENCAHDKAFGAPIVGFARGDDQIFEKFKKDIGVFYLTPLEAFLKVYPESRIGPDELTIISWILPHMKQTKMDNRRESSHPSERWARGKKFGVLVNMKLQDYLIKTLKEAGHDAMAPCAPQHWSEQMSEKYGYSSTWSERHAAYAAGLGTFGLCDGLITPVGKAMRCGSVIARIAITPTNRSYKRHTEYCLFLTDGTCGTCITRCPVGAITEKGHDKDKCKAYLDTTCTEYAKKYFDIETNVCGLCQTRVPCESGIPKKKSRQRRKESQEHVLCIDSKLIKKEESPKRQGP
jgi:epoxyqueuosine reductase